MASITLTGIGPHTPLSVHVALGVYGAELGILYRESEAKPSPRYPSKQQILDLLEAVSKYTQFTPRYALHICGRDARASFFAGKLRPIVSRMSRVQINGDLNDDDWDKLSRAKGSLCVILQATACNMRHDLRTVHLLADESGGHGVLPKEWKRPNTAYCPLIGYAGGLGPDNLECELEKIAAIAKGPFWVDMQTGIRDGRDQFDIDMAMWAVMAFRRWHCDARKRYNI